MIATSDSIESSLLIERIARRFTSSRELNEEARNQIIANALEIKDTGRIKKMKVYFKEQARKLGKYLGVDKNLERGFLGQELTPTNQLALSDFEKAIEFIYNTGISPTIKGNIDEKERHQEIAKEIVSKSIELEAKDYDPASQILSSAQLSQTTQGANRISGSPSTLTPEQMMAMMQQQFGGQFAEFKKQQDEENKSKIAELKQQHEQQINELKQQLLLETQQREIALQQHEEENRKRTEQQIQAEKEERQRQLEEDRIRTEELYSQQQEQIGQITQQNEQQINRLDQQREEDRIRTEQQIQAEKKERQKQILKLLQETQETKTNQQKLKKLAEIADFAPNLEVTIGVGGQAQTMKLGDLMKDSQNKTHNLEQNLGSIISQIQLQFENQEQRLDQIEESRPSPIIRGVQSSCFPKSKMCVLM
jgi:hypothetical protein